MTGENGAVMARLVKTATETPTIRIVNTATGRRRQLFSPSPAKNGSASSTAIPMTGPTSSAKVSMCGGISASAAKIQRKKKSGLGTVSIIVGSGAPVGPNGPNQTEHPITASVMSPAKTTSFWNATGTNGRPSL